MTNLILIFYDKQLYTISCDYNRQLKDTFLAKYETSIALPVRSFRLCTQDNDKTLSMWGEYWRHKDTVAIIAHRKGYAEDCQQEEKARLLFVSQELAALTSDCDLIPIDPFIEIFGQLIR